MLLFLFFLLFYFFFHYYCSVYKGSMLCQFVLSLCVCAFCIYVLLLIYKNIKLTCQKFFKQLHIN